MIDGSVLQSAQRCFEKKKSRSSENGGKRVKNTSCFHEKKQGIISPSYTTSREVRWKTRSAECGVWKTRSVENAECGKAGV